MSFKIIKYKGAALFLLFILFSANVFAAEFYSINALYGISMREANSVCKDKNGFVWASSKTGILRLTDNDYRIYQLPYESADVFTVNLVYSHNTLIVFTNNGQVFSYNPVFDRFDLILNIGKALNDDYLVIHSLLLDDSHVFWMATSSGLFKFQSGKLSLIEDISNERYELAWMDKQHFLVVKTDGIWSFDIQTSAYNQIHKNKTDSPFNVSSLFFDKSQNKLWIGTLSNGLFFYDFDSELFSDFLSSDFPRQPVLAITANTDSTLLAGIDGQGIWEFDKRTNRVLDVYKENANDPSSLRGNGVYDLFCDQNGRVWICTFSGGVSYFDLASPIVNQIVHQINDENSLVNNDVNSIIEDRWGKLWLATNNGISCWDVASNQWKNFYNNKHDQSQVFLSLCEDNDGRIWAGTYSSGVYILDEKTGKELAHYSQKEEGMPVVNDFILKIYKDSQGDIWLGGVNGEFMCYQWKSKEFRKYPEEPVSSFAELSEDQIFLGCSYGLALLDKQTGNIKKLLLGLLVHDLIVLGDNVWICTGGDGLVKYNYKSGETEKFTMQSGLPSNFINSIIYDSGFLWIGTESGLCRFNPKDNSAQTYASIPPLSRSSYNVGACLGLKNGQLAWGTNKGAAIFTPEALKESPSKGKIFFQDVTVSGRSIRDISSFRLSKTVDSLQTIRLKYYQNTFSLELIPIGISPGAKFSWKMDGLDEDWTTPTGNKIVTYTNLPSGEFQLKVKLYDGSQKHVISERSIALRVIPPFWRKVWFLGLLFVFVLGIIFLFLLIYINRLKQKHTEEKVRFFTNTAHDIRTSLTLIKAPVEQLSQETNLSESGKSYLKLAREQAQQLSTVVTQLMDFQKVDIGKEQAAFFSVDLVKLISDRKLLYESFAKSRDIELVFTRNCTSYTTAVDELKMEKVVDNLISNAVKYSRKGTQVQIDLKCYESKWGLQVIDQGIGINRKAQRKLFKEFYRSDNAINSKVVGSGIGLLLVKKYVTMHGGSISCNSQEDVGSTFQVVIPHKTGFKTVKKVIPVADTSLIADPVLNVSQNSLVKNKIHFAKRMRIVIAEDNDDLLHFMQSTLSNEFEVITAGDGKKAWKLISTVMPDLVVSDIMMPNMDGFVLCQLIKSTYETSHIPVILLTALSEKTKQLHGLGLGADDYLTKPFDVQLLVQRIKTIIGNRVIVREKALKLIKGSSEEPILNNEINDKFIKQMLDAVKANISNSGFGKDEFAMKMNVSPSLLYKKIKSLTDQSPTEFIRNVRLNHALELLQTSKYTVTEVSELCGFTSAGYFSTVFRKHFGKSPSEVSI